MATPVQESVPKQLLERMVASRQLSSFDVETLAKLNLQSEDEILRWLATEYGLGYTTLDDVEPDRQLLSLFPARILLKEELLPLKRTNNTIEVATSRLFATQGLDALKTMTGLQLKPISSPRAKSSSVKSRNVSASVRTPSARSTRKRAFRATTLTTARRTKLRSSVSSTKF
jgi:hypothetical protein